MRAALMLLWVAICAAAAGWIIVLMWREGAWQWTHMALGQRTAVLLLTAFALAPFVLLVLAVWRSLADAKRLIRVSAIGLITMAVGIYLVYDALFVSRGDQRGLIFLFVPPIQLVGAIIALAFTPRKAKNEVSNA